MAGTDTPQFITKTNSTLPAIEFTERLRDHTPHKLTTETPTELPMEQRVAVHHIAFDALLTHYGTRA